jgi:hypothetical protein
MILIVVSFMLCALTRWLASDAFADGEFEHHTGIFPGDTGCDQ